MLSAIAMGFLALSLLVLLISFVFTGGDKVQDDKDKKYVRKISLGLFLLSMGLFNITYFMQM